MRVYLLWRETMDHRTILKGVYSTKVKAMAAAGEIIHGIEWADDDHPEGSCSSKWSTGYRVVITPEKVDG